MSQKRAPSAFSPGQLDSLVSDVLSEARKLGASAAEASISLSQGLNVNVRLGEVETVEHTRDKGLSVSVYFGHKSGSASSTDLSPEALRQCVRAASSIARFTADDEFSGLADPEDLATEIPDLDLCHPWAPDTETAIQLAKQCEDVARAADSRISNSEGASVSTHEGLEVYGNTHGFMASTATTRHSVSVAVIAQDDIGMQRDHWYSTARDSRELVAPDEIGRVAAHRTVRRLGGRKLSTCTAPVIFEAPIASSLISHFVGGIRGANLYRRASFLLDQLDKQIFAPSVRIYEQPFLKKGLGSSAFDGDGVAPKNRDLVQSGVLKGYVLDVYSARKLGLRTTGNAGGVHNLTIDSGNQDLPALMRDMGRGLLVTELIGFGVNTVTGDYSRGASGFWIEHGEIQYPVEEITIAGNLRDMFRAISAVGNDMDVRGNIRSGSILIDSMTIAGA